MRFLATFFFPVSPPPVPLSPSSQVPCRQVRPLEHSLGCSQLAPQPLSPEPAAPPAGAHPGRPGGQSSLETHFLGASSPGRLGDSLDSFCLICTLNGAFVEPAVPTGEPPSSVA